MNILAELRRGNSLTTQTPSEGGISLLAYHYQWSEVVFAGVILWTFSRWIPGINPGYWPLISIADWFRGIHLKSLSSPQKKSWHQKQFPYKWRVSEQGHKNTLTSHLLKWINTHSPFNLTPHPSETTPNHKKSKSTFFCLWQSPWIINNCRSSREKNNTRKHENTHISRQAA